MKAYTVRAERTTKGAAKFQVRNTDDEEIFNDEVVYLDNVIQTIVRDYFDFEDDIYITFLGGDLKVKYNGYNLHIKISDSEEIKDFDSMEEVVDVVIRAVKAAIKQIKEKKDEIDVVYATFFIE